MKQYLVIALSVGGPNNKIYRAKQVVTEDNFRPGRAEELVQLGFLRLLPATSQATHGNNAHAPAAGGLPAYDDISVKEIKLRLDIMHIEYPLRAVKQELYDLLTR